MGGTRRESASSVSQGRGYRWRSDCSHESGSMSLRRAEKSERLLNVYGAAVQEALAKMRQSSIARSLWVPLCGLALGMLGHAAHATIFISFDVTGATSTNP